MKKKLEEIPLYMDWRSYIVRPETKEIRVDESIGVNYASPTEVANSLLALTLTEAICEIDQRWSDEPATFYVRGWRPMTDAEIIKMEAALPVYRNNMAKQAATIEQKERDQYERLKKKFES